MGLCARLCVWPLKCAEGVVCHCASVSLPVTNVCKAKEGGVGEEMEKRTDGNARRRDSEAVVGEEFELDNCFRETVCACVFVLEV